MDHYKHSSSFNNLTDEELLEAIKQGNSPALSVIFERYGKLVYGLALRILKNPQEAEDLTQDIFLALWRNASKYPDCRYFVRYLISMTRSRSIDKLRSHQRKHNLLEKWGKVMNQEAQLRNPVEEATIRERAANISQVLAKLPQKQREVIEMAYKTGLTQADISQQLNIPLGTVKSRTRQGLLKLKQLLLDSDFIAYE
jgi:RNA polymerase sigma-70 factor (ECF subfamily)